MRETEFRAALMEVLARSTDGARERLRRVLAAIPEGAEELRLRVFPEQDGEGAFGVRASVGGPGRYGLDRALGEDAQLFDVIHTADGLEPPVPLVDPSSCPFEVNDVIVDCAAAWLEEIWQSLGPPVLSIPAAIHGSEGYGTVTPVALAPPP